MKKKEGRYSNAINEHRISATGGYDSGHVLIKNGKNVLSSNEIREDC
jgi:hypothetical protein